MKTCLGLVGVGLFVVAALAAACVLMLTPFWIAFALSSFHTAILVQVSFVGAAVVLMVLAILGMFFVSDEVYL